VGPALNPLGKVLDLVEGGLREARYLKVSLLLSIKLRHSTVVKAVWPDGQNPLLVQDGTEVFNGRSAIRVVIAIVAGQMYQESRIVSPRLTYAGRYIVHVSVPVYGLAADAACLGAVSNNRSFYRRADPATLPPDLAAQ
jgi:hypothetical protein